MFERNERANSVSNSHSSADSALDTLSTVSLFILFVVSVSLLSFFISSVLLPARASAQTSALANDPATLAAAAEDKATPRTYIFNGQLVLETARTADEAEAASYSGWYMATASATHKKLGMTATARLGYSQEYSYRRDDGTNGSFDNPSLSVAKSFLNGRDYENSWIDSVSVSASGSVGANNESARRTLLWTNGLTVTGAKNLGRFNLRQAFGYTHSFFEYDIRDNGVVNSPSSFRTLTTLYYDINDRLSVGASFTYAYAISFQNVGRGTQFTSATLDYMITPKISASIGVASERSTIEPDGQSDRIRFYAPESAQYFADLILIL